ncbi:MAG: bifunctional nuclease family protein [Bacteroidota bacterium]
MAKQKKIELHIIALAQSESSQGNYVIILEEEKGFRRLPITIGAFEAQAIAVALEKIETQRPLTHDLFKDTLTKAGIRIQSVYIQDLTGGVFHATLIGKKADGSKLEVDARSSDAIAMAVRFSCSIYTTEEVMEEAGIPIENKDTAITQYLDRMADYSLEELERLLTQVIAQEDYEQASKIRDAIAERIKGR